MSTVKRIISGSLSSWARIVITVFSQMLLVPLYLSHWNVQTYGVWLAIQALVSVLATLDTGHQNFLAYEFLKFGKVDKMSLRKILWSGSLIGLCLGFLQIVVIFLLIVTNLLPKLIDKSLELSADLLKDGAYVLMFQGISWLLCGSVGGLLGRALAPFGYYPRMSWWGVFAALVTSVSPAIAVLAGADLFTTGLVAAMATVVYNIPVYYDMFRLLNKEGLMYIKPSLPIGLKNFGYSLALSGKSLLENARQQGVRLILTPLAGVAALAAFATMRTGANVALQGLNTLVNPLEPELMRFLHQRDQSRTESAFGTIWIVLIAIMAPAVVVLQVFIGPAYDTWTRGKIPFDPLLFAALSLGVLVYALAQPAIAVVIGNNLLKVQLLLSGVAALAVVGGMWLTVPHFGIRGAGGALLMAEILSTTGYRYAAKRWLEANGLKWPQRPSKIAALSVWLAAIGMFLLSTNPEYKYLILFFTLLFLFINLRLYWKSLPELAITNADKIFKKIPGLSKILQIK